MTTLFIMPRAGVEAVFATAAIEAYLHEEPGHTLLLAVSPESAGLFALDDRFAAVYTYPIGTLLGSWRRFGAFAAALKTQHGILDKVINLDNRSVSAWLAARMSAHERFGFKTRCRPPFVWKKAVAADPAIHRALNYLHPMEAVLHRHFEEPVQPRIKAYKPDRQEGVGLAASGKPGSPTDWGMHRWAETALRLSQLAPVMLLASEGGQRSAKRMDEVLEYNGQNRFTNFSQETSLELLKAQIAALKLFVGGEGVLTQLAMALGVPTVMIMGSHDPVKTGPLKGVKAKLIYKKADCAPCEKPKCLQRHPACLNAIVPAEVIAAAKALLEG